MSKIPFGPTYDEMLNPNHQSPEVRKEALKAKLPYSSELFGIPNNVYLVGTMNTADRSIALLDTAFRRRFNFEEIMPKTELLQGVEVEGIEIEKLLEKLNERIIVLIDREHQIGHSYFMSLIDEDPSKQWVLLKEIFINKVIPLLQEYFYDDYRKIDLVFGGNGFIIKRGIDGLFNKNSRILDYVDESYETYSISPDAIDSPENYLKIYKDSISNENE